MKDITIKELVEAGAHFGHLTRRWNPKMKPYIFMEKNGIHIIDLMKTKEALTKAAEEMGKIAALGKPILFVGTKKQAKGIIESEARRCKVNWVSERWLGGMLTNFATIRKSVRKMKAIDKQEVDGTFDKLTKKERLMRLRERDKLRKFLEGVESLENLPGALFIVDVKKEAIAVGEAKKLNIPVFAIVDTNCDPDPIDYVIPANDDAVKTIELITSYLSDSIIEGYAKAEHIKAEAKAEAEKENKMNEKNDEDKPKVIRRSKKKVEEESKSSSEQN
jgi:small subunit ribosomal protein S2